MNRIRIVIYSEPEVYLNGRSYCHKPSVDLFNELYSNIDLSIEVDALDIPNRDNPLVLIPSDDPSCQAYRQSCCWAPSTAPIATGVYKEEQIPRIIKKTRKYINSDELYGWIKAINIDLRDISFIPVESMWSSPTNILSLQSRIDSSGPKEIRSYLI